MGFSLPAIRQGVKGCDAFFLFHSVRDETIKTRVSLVVLTLSFMIVPPGCAHSERPVLYPNNHLKQVGNDQAQAEIDECMRLAKECGADSSSGGNFPNIAQSLHRGPDHHEPKLSDSPGIGCLAFRLRC